MKHFFAFFAFLFLFAITAKAQPAGPIFSGFPPGGVGAACLAANQGYLMPVTGGTQLVLCDPATHLWTIVAGGGGGTCTSLAGDVTGPCNANVVAKVPIGVAIRNGATNTGVLYADASGNLHNDGSFLWDNTNSLFTVGKQSADNFGSVILLRKRGTTANANAAVASGAALGNIAPSAWNGSAYSTSSGADFAAVADEAWTTMANGTRWQLATVVDGTTTGQWSWRMNHNGNITHFPTAVLQWPSSGDANSTGNVDVGVTRNAAGVVEINTGTKAGTYGSGKWLSQTLTGLAGGGTQCVTVDNNGVLGTSGATCGNGSFQDSFTNQTSIAITHNFNTSVLTYQCFNGSGVWIEPNTVTQTSANILTITFINAQTGTCNVIAQGGTGGGGSGISGINVTPPITTTGGTTPTIGINNFTGDSGSGGLVGAVPAPASGDAAANKVLGAGGTWVTQTSGTSTVLIVTGHGNHTMNGSIANEFFSSCDSSGGVITLTLPASPSTGEIHNVKKIDASANACTLSGNGKNVDGNATMNIATTMGGLSVYYDGTQWYIIGII